MQGKSASCEVDYALDGLKWIQTGTGEILRLGENLLNRKKLS